MKLSLEPKPDHSAGRGSRHRQGREKWILCDCRHYFDPRGLERADTRLGRSTWDRFNETDRSGPYPYPHDRDQFYRRCPFFSYPDWRRCAKAFWKQNAIFARPVVISTYGYVLECSVNALFETHRWWKAIEFALTVMSRNEPWFVHACGWRRKSDGIESDLCHFLDNPDVHYLALWYHSYGALVICRMAK